MLRKLHKGKKITDIENEFKEGERFLLCSNKDNTRSPSLDLGIKPDSTDDELIKILAGILLEDIIWQHEHRKHYTKQSGDLLPGIDKGTG